MSTNNRSEESKVAEAPLPNGASGTSGIEGKAATGSGERGGSRSSFNSKKIYVGGELHRDVRVPFREISLAPTKSMNGEMEANEPVRVYDTSGPWGDPDFHGDVEQGLPPLRAKWIRDRGDVKEYDGRVVRPIDDGYLSEKHAALHDRKRPSFNGAGAPSRRKPLRASAHHPVTQLWYARQESSHPRWNSLPFGKTWVTKL
jgi:phosphomethylpyrimidine synthase